MASEASSAVLELNDDDEDAEDPAPSVADEPQEGAPLIMEHGYDIAVKVDAPMKQLSTLETYVTYRVRCACARWPSPPAVRRRYNHFKVLRRRLSLAHPLLACPPLPPLHSARQQLDRYSPAFVAVRTRALHLFLDCVAKHPILTHCEDFRIFLTTPDEELDKIFKSENNALNLWGLSAALYGGGAAAESRPAANGARVKDPEFSALGDYLEALQHKLTALCALAVRLHRGTVALAAQLGGMKRACDAWSTQARGGAARAAAACGAGAGGAGAAAARARAPLRARAALPLLAAYCAAQRDQLRQRDCIHAAHVAGNDSGELHNRLEQASEALRSELSDWVPKTHSEIKSLLLDIADRQVSICTQTLMSWENAQKMSTEANIEELFKTVSKTAVQNLSPSKCKDVTPTETDKDLDDMDYSNEDSDFECEVRKAAEGLSRRLEDPEASSSKKECPVLTIDESRDLEESKSDSNAVRLGFEELKLESNGSKLDSFESNVSKDLEELRLDSNESKSDSKMSKLESKSETLSDPLRSFSEVDLSS